MPSPQDDSFLGPTLETQWAFAEAPASGSPPGYSFTANTNNITIDVTTLATLLQAVIWTDYYVELGITEDNAMSVGRFGGLLIQSAVAGTYLEFVKYFDSGSGLPRLRVTSYIASAPTTVDDIAWAFGVNIILRIVKHDGFFSFFYKQSADAAFTQTPHTLAATADYSSAPGNYAGLEAGGNNAPNYSFLANHFYFRSLIDIVTNGSVVVSVTKDVTTNANILAQVSTYPSISKFVVKQHADQRMAQLNWDALSITGAQFTLQSPSGRVFDVMVDDNGVIETEPSVYTPIPNPIVQADDGSFYAISVDDNGVPVATSAPGAVFADSTLIILSSTPTGTAFEIYVAASGAYATTRQAAYTYLGVTIVRNPDRVPNSVSDGEVILTDSFLTSFLDGPLVGLSRYHYAAFAVYNI